MKSIGAASRIERRRRSLFFKVIPFIILKEFQMSVLVAFDREAVLVAQLASITVYRNMYHGCAADPNGVFCDAGDTA